MFNRPTLPELIARIRADVMQKLNADDALRRSDGEVYARALAGGVHGLYAYLQFMALQLFPDTATGIYLDRHASIWLKVPRKQATAAVGNLPGAAFVIQSGAVIPVGTVLSAIDKVQYQTTGAAIISGLTATAPISALVAGIAGNRATGQTLNLVSPIPGVQTAALTSGAVSGGTDIESDDDLRARILARIKEEPHGGSANDYVTWALEVPGVTRAWLYPGEMGAGSVTLRFMRDGDANPIPDLTAVAAMQVYLAVRRPVTAKVYVAAPIPNPQNFTIALTPNDTTTQAAVLAALTDLIRRESSPGGWYWSDALAATVQGGSMLLSHINEAIAGATGETDHTMSVPSANISNAAGYITTLGAPTWG